MHISSSGVIRPVPDQQAWRPAEPSGGNSGCTPARTNVRNGDFGNAGELGASLQLVQASRRTVGHPGCTSGCPFPTLSMPTHLQKRPASIHSAIGNSASTGDFVASAHCTGIFTAAPEIQAALT